MSQYLKCDAVGCGHREEIEELTADMVGKKCPVCSENLLTQQDFEDGQRSEQIFKALCKAGILTPAPFDAPGQLLIINPHAGAVNISIRGEE